MFLIALVAFGAESLIMAVLDDLQGISNAKKALIDSLVLVAFLSPALYLFLFQPLTRTLERQKDVEKALRGSNEQLLFEISERRAADKTLQAERHKLQSILDSMEDGVWISSPSYRVQYLNPAVERQFGPVRGRDCYAYFERRTEPCDDCPMQEVLAGRTLKREFTSPRNGRTYEATDTPVEGAEGETLKLQILHDLSERKQNEEALRRSESRLRMLMEEASDGIGIIDRKGVLQEVNPELCEMLGFARDELIGMPLTSLIPAEDLAANPVDLESFEHGGVRRIERRMRRKNGEVLNLEVSARRLADGSIQGILRDVTGQKAEREELQRSREALRKLAVHLQSVREEERKAVAREIHDELGQVLTALNMDVSWVARRLPASDPALQEKVRGISGLLKDSIRMVQRIASELRPGILDDLGLAPAVEWQASEFQKRTGIACSVEIEPESLTAGRDAGTALFRIVQEALTNVTRHAEAKSVKIRLLADADATSLEVEDDGWGIAEESARDPKSLGLVGMRERALALGGELKVGRGAAGGTKLVARIPHGEALF
jgi:PAS domain S-box-containing protein